MTLHQQNTAHAEQLVAVDDAPMMEVSTTRFGVVQVGLEDRFVFPTGIPGFPGPREMFLFPNPGGGAFEWLHGADGCAIGFAVMEPDDGVLQVLERPTRTAARMLGWDDEDEITIRLVVAIPAGRPDQATLNLRAPMLLNRTRSVGAQPVLNDDTLPFRLALFPENHG